MSSSPIVPGIAPAEIQRPQEPSVPDLVVEARRIHEGPRPYSPFRDVLTGGVGLLMRGAEVATSVVAGPVMAAAVRSAGIGATSAVGGAGGGPLSPSSATGAGSSAVPTSLLAPGSDQSEMATMQAMQRESQVFNMQLLELQENVQQENRRFTTVSNVLRAKHDTAKAAVSNIRS
jgi:hypothetical protein